MIDLNDTTKLRLFLSKRQSIESDLEKLEKKGVPAGRSINIEQEERIDLRNYDSQIVRGAENMEKCYKLLYCFENDLRNKVTEMLQEKFGDHWWKNQVDPTIQKEVENRQTREKDSIMLMRSEDDSLIYTTLGELKKIILDNWPVFETVFRSKRFVEKLLMEINQYRVVVAHSAELNEKDVEQLESKIVYWNSQDPSIAI